MSSGRPLAPRAPGSTGPRRRSARPAPGPLAGRALFSRSSFATDSDKPHRECSWTSFDMPATITEGASARVHTGHMVYVLYRRHGFHRYRGEGVGCGFDAVLLMVEEA